MLQCTHLYLRLCNHLLGSRLSWRNSSGDSCKTVSALIDSIKLRHIYWLGAICEDVLAIRVHPVGDKAGRQAVPLIKGYAGAQRVGACSALLALLRLHVQKLPLTTGEGYEGKRKSRKRRGHIEKVWTAWQWTDVIKYGNGYYLQIKAAIQNEGVQDMSKMRCRRRTPTALSALDWIWEAGAYFSFVGNRHSPSRAKYVTLCVLKVIIWLQGQNTGVSFTRLDKDTLYI